jgi:wyosine [tRNA(Phe)-imidazoG37] synthetase (radical SAM superfamily)
MMSKRGYKHVYGPVPSRRLGRSLGVDLVPFKTCTLDCIYCQLGRTTNKTVERREYVSAEAVLVEVKEKLSVGASPDYITVAGSGEPTLNSAIGGIIAKIKELTDVPVAVLTNGSLLWRREVQDDLMMSDIVIPSLDAGDENMFHYVNRPHRDISFRQMVDGTTSFTERFQGEVWLEVMLLSGITGLPNEVKKIASLAEQIAPARIHLNTVIRPPAEDYACPLSDAQLSSVKQVFPRLVEIVSEKAFRKQDKASHPAIGAGDILLLISRRPCTASDIAEGLCVNIIELYKRLDELITEGKAKRISMGGQAFYVADAAPK